MSAPALEPPAVGDNGFRNIFSLHRALNEFLSPLHRKMLYRVFAIAALLALVEAATAAAIGPYIRCLSGECETGGSGLSGTQSVVLASAGILAILTVRAAVLIWFNDRTQRLNQKVQADTVISLLDGYLHLDWPRFRTQHQSHYFRRCATTALDASWVVTQVVQLVSSVMVLAVMITLAMVQAVIAAVIVGVGVVVGGYLTHLILGRRIREAGNEREDALRSWTHAMSEAFSSFKEIRVYGREQFFQDRIAHHVRGVGRGNYVIGLLPTIPRAVLEVVVFGAVTAIVGVWYASGRDLGDLLPTLAFFGIVARASLPALMNLLSLRTLLAGSIINLELVAAERAASAPRVERITVATATGTSAIVLDSVAYRHDDADRPVLDSVTIELPTRGWTALTGASGAGKSTLVELICGLLQPQSGTIVHRRPHGTEPVIAYLPQQVAILDATLAENVVFGNENIEDGAILHALENACLGDVVASLPLGIHTVVGPRGVELSGGERQRLAVARALLRKPDLLLLDEATSGLDAATEERLLSSVRSGWPETDVILISHRAQSLTHADRIFEISDGAVVPVRERVL